MKPKKLFSVAILSLLLLQPLASGLAGSSPRKNERIVEKDSSGNVIELIKSAKKDNENSLPTTPENSINDRTNIPQERQSTNESYPSGLVSPSKEELEAVSERSSKITTSGSIPDAVDWSTSIWFPPIGNQGDEGSCACFATAYYTKTFQEAREHGWNLSEADWIGGAEGYPSQTYWDRIFSPDFVYHQINKGVDTGLSLWDAMDLIYWVGASTWETMPYEDDNSTSWPSEAAWREAPLYRAATKGQVFSFETDEGINRLKTVIANSNMGVIGVDSGQLGDLKELNSTEGDIWTTDNLAKTEMNHAQTVVGYNDSLSYNESGDIHHGAFRIANSWGKGFPGDHNSDGCYWISYEAMKQKLAVPYVSYYNDSKKYTPSTLAVLEIDHTKRNESLITLGEGTPSSPLTTKKMYPIIDEHGLERCLGWRAGDHPFSNSKVVIDMTRIVDNDGKDFFLNVTDVGTSTTGMVEYFAVEKYKDGYRPHADPEVILSSSSIAKGTINGDATFVTVQFPDDLKNRSYSLWSQKITGESGQDMTKLSDLNGDGYDEFLFASSMSGDGNLTILNGKNGSQIAVTSSLGYEPRETVYLNNRIVVSAYGGFQVFDTDLNLLRTVSGLVDVQFLQPFQGNVTLVSDETNILSYNLSTGNKAWNHTLEYASSQYAHYKDLLTVSNRVVGVFPNPDTGDYDLELLAENGTQLEWGHLLYSSDSDTVKLYPYENPYGRYFLLTKENSTMTTLSFEVITNLDSDPADEVGYAWKNIVDRATSSVQTVIDVNNDDYKEILSVYNGKIAVYNATGGNMLYTTHIDGYYLFDTAILGDITGDGLSEVAVCTMDSSGELTTYLISFNETQSSVIWETNKIGPIEGISDVDGDGLKDLILFGGPDPVYCIGTAYDDTLPTINNIGPSDDRYTDSNTVSFNAEANDPESGVAYVELHINNSAYNLTYNENQDIYETTLDLENGVYTWNIGVWDASGSATYTEERTLYIDTEPPGTPSITAPADGANVSTDNVRVEWNATTDSGTGIQGYWMKNDTGTWTAIGNTTSYLFNNLPEGEHTVHLKAYDLAGNNGSTISVSFTVDTIKPNFSYLTPNKTIFNTTSPSIQWRGSDTGTGIQVFQWRIDGGTWYNKTTANKTFSNLAEGTHTFTVWAYDWAGNIRDPTLTFTVDTETPTLSITSPADGATIEKSSVTVEWSGNDAGSGINYYEVQIDDGGWEQVSGTSYKFTGVNDGEHTVDVRAVDKSGKTSTKPVTFTVNTSPIGGPGMMEEIAIGIGVGVVIVAVVVVLYFKKWKKE